MKVYSGNYFVPGVGQRRCIIAAKTQREAARLVGVSRHEIQTYWAETANEKEVIAAMAFPGVLMYVQMEEHFYPVEKE